MSLGLKGCEQYRGSPLPGLGYAPSAGLCSTGADRSLAPQLVRSCEFLEARAYQSWGYQLSLLVFTLCTSCQPSNKRPLPPSVEMKCFVT